MDKILSFTRGILLGIVGIGFVIGTTCNTATAAEGGKEQARTLVHLLDYIGQDYAGAVDADGRILNQFEYNEMLEFCQSALDLNPAFSDSSVENEIQVQLEQLQQRVQNKAQPQLIAQLSRQLKNQVVQAADLPSAPAQWPDLTNGKALYSQNCAVCHGPDGKGNGQVADTLEPRPTNFYDHERMQQVSPFQAYNTINLGIPGTGMAAFKQLNDQQIWDLAFYVLSLRHQERMEGASESMALPALPLDTVAVSSDQELLSRLEGTEQEQKQKLAAVRLRSGDETAPAFSTALAFLDAAGNAYKAGDFNAARQKGLAAYLEGIEPVEPRLRAVAPGLVRDLETRMTSVRTAIQERQPESEVLAAIQSARESVQQAESELSQSKSSPTMIYSLALGIVLREGFEAILVIIAVLGVLRAMNSRKGIVWVHIGWLSALGVGVVAWFFSDWLLAISGLQREMMEAVVALSAVVILLYLGFWMHSRTEIGRWKAFIQERVQNAVRGGNMFGLAAIAFLAVFREAFETVLFLSALSLEGGEASKSIMASGVFTAFFLVVVLAWAMVKFSTRIPIRTLFGISSGLMVILAIILTGKGLHALQETGFLSMTTTDYFFRVDLLGFYPTLETLAFQAVVLLAAAILWAYGNRPSQPQTA